ncbi:MAG: patatin-like phospholipase family protein [Acidobacteria bacterium]|nr:patatin-like phospholipase family protein [Acidobacteriota bacterium]
MKKIFEFFKPKVALALGGGGARGLSHLGVIALLEKENIKVDMVVGTSIGALVGAVYCDCGDAISTYSILSKYFSSEHFELEYFQKVKKLMASTGEKASFWGRLKKIFLWGSFALKTSTKESFIPKEKVDGSVDVLFGDKCLEDLPIKLAVIASDLNSGQEVVLTKGKIADAVKASIAIAGIFPSAKIEGKTLIDGGYVNQIPVEDAFKLGADVVIAVDVSSQIPILEEEEKITGGKSQIRAAMILAETARKYQLRFADVVIKPDLKDLFWTEFDKIEEFFERGFVSAKESIPLIKRKIRAAKVKKSFWNIFGRKWSVDFKKEGI